MQKDPHPGDLGIPSTVVNGYIYCGNNPIMRSDPSGLSWLDWLVDGIIAVAVGVAIVASGGTVLGALAAIGSVAGGAAAGAAVYATAACAISGNWGEWGSNFGGAFHTGFRIGAAFLGGSVLAADLGGGGLVGAGGNGLQGWVQSANPIFGQGGGLTIGSAAVYSGVAPNVYQMAGGAVATYGAHEFGHTLQYIGLSGLGPVGGNAVYGGMGLWGYAAQSGASGIFGSMGGWWEGMAGSLGQAF